MGDSLGLQFMDSMPHLEMADDIPSPVRSPPDIGQMYPAFLVSFLGAYSPRPPWWRETGWQHRQLSAKTSVLQGKVIPN